jgi:hypothetical protein
MIVLIILRRVEHSEPPDLAIDTCPAGPPSHTETFHTPRKKRKKEKATHRPRVPAQSVQPVLTLSPWDGSFALTGIQLWQRLRPAPARLASMPPRSRQIMRSQHCLPLMEARPLRSTTAQLAASWRIPASSTAKHPQHHQRQPFAAPAPTPCSSGGRS